MPIRNQARVSAAVSSRAQDSNRRFNVRQILPELANLLSPSGLPVSFWITSPANSFDPFPLFVVQLI
jgi:hypothetical protein